jgi:DNA-binding PadR family transcriptional regulator
MGKSDYLGAFEELVLLAVARLGEDGYGMTLRTEIQERTGRDVSIGSVYSTLERLEAKQLVVSREGDPTPVRGGRARRHFQVAPDGVRALQNSRAASERMWEGLDLGAADRA